jgi:hypothetical protein
MVRSRRMIMPSVSDDWSIILQVGLDPLAAR